MTIENVWFFFEYLTDPKSFRSIGECLEFKNKWFGNPLVWGNF